MRGLTIGSSSWRSKSLFLFPGYSDGDKLAPRVIARDYLPKDGSLQEDKLEIPGWNRLVATTQILADKLYLTRSGSTAQLRAMCLPWHRHKPILWFLMLGR